jgi:excisionase family DNA binding protein
VIGLDDAGLDEIAERIASKVAAKLATHAAAPEQSAGFGSLESIADALGLSGSYLRRLARQGRVPGAFRAGRAWRARRADVEAALRAGVDRPRDAGVVDLQERARQLLAKRVGGIL